MWPAPLELDLAAAWLASPAEIRARQQARWTLLLQAAERGSRYFRQRLAGRDPAHTPLQAMAATDKAGLMAHFADWVTDPRLELSALRDFTTDPTQVGEPWLGEYAVWESSGSTGEPTLFVQDAQALAVYDALEASRRNSPRPWQRLFDPFYLGERLAFVGAIDGHFASEVTMRRLRRAQPWRAPSWRSFSILQPIAALAAELEAFGPSIVATYPSAALLLAQEVEQRRLSIAPQEVWTGGETLTATMRAAIERGLGCPLRNSYGASEFLPIAWECAHQHLHVNADWVVLEPVDDRGRPVPAGQPSATTLLTNLANHLQPIIRLDIGDCITVDESPCGCGCRLPVIEVQGRNDDMLTLAGQGGESVTLLPLALVSVLEDEVGVVDFRLEQRGPSSLRLLLGPGQPATAAQACRRALRAFAARQGLAPLQLQLVENHESCVGRSGKRQRIVAGPRRRGPLRGRA